MVATGVLTGMLLFATDGLAAANSIKITGPQHVRVGASPKFVISGYSNAARGVATYLDKRGCARTVAAEQNRSARKLLFDRRIHAGSFRFTDTIGHSVLGRHVICAYLYNRIKGAPTVRRAEFDYVTS